MGLEKETEEDETLGMKTRQKGGGALESEQIMIDDNIRAPCIVTEFRPIWQCGSKDNWEVDRIRGGLYYKMQPSQGWRDGKIDRWVKMKHFQSLRATLMKTAGYVSLCSSKGSGVGSRREEGSGGKDQTPGHSREEMQNDRWRRERRG